MSTHGRRRRSTSGLLSAITLAALTGGTLTITPGSASAVTGAAFTTVNENVDDSGHCKNGNPDVNCNIYDGKQYVWLNGGPTANGLGPDGQYFFAVLAPGGQPNPNDGGAKNLSDDFDAYTNRTFTVTNGEVSAYAASVIAAMALRSRFSTSCCSCTRSALTVGVSETRSR